MREGGYTRSDTTSSTVAVVTVADSPLKKVSSHFLKVYLQTIEEAMIVDSTVHEYGRYVLSVTSAGNQ